MSANPRATRSLRSFGRIYQRLHVSKQTASRRALPHSTSHSHTIFSGTLQFALVSTVYLAKSSESHLHARRAFSQHAQHRVQPSPAPETDPQNISSSALPDITNYYTLFPSTIPYGPPGSPSQPMEQSPTATPYSSSSSPSTSSAKFTIHLPTLRKEFLHLQSIHHPDKYPTGSPSHQKALALSALINNAYKTLTDPLLRAQYLLQLRYDIDVTSEDNSAHPTDQETLLEVMEAQERVEDAASQNEIDQIMQENLTRLTETEKVMGVAFEEGDVQRAKEECIKLKYWRSLQGVLVDWEPGKEVRLVH